MTLRLAVAFAAALVAAVRAVSLATAQAPPPPDAKEMAAVQTIRARIEARASAAAAKPAAAYTVTIPNTTVAYGMAPVPAGSFVMGSTAPGAKPDEQPTRTVRLDAFWMQTHEVTWDSYLMFMFADQAQEAGRGDTVVDALSRPTAPHLEMSFGRGNNGFPAISMTQHAANKYAQWLSAKTGEFYRLPTEAEWEYACRAGSAPGPAAGTLGEYAWFVDNSPVPPFTDGTYHKVATKKPNAWGLHDMLGNVMEWTLDQYAPYTAAATENPRVAVTTAYPHAVRGGSWHDPEAAVRCTARVASDASWKKLDPQLPKSEWYMTNAQWLGFRLVRPSKLPDANEMYRVWNNGVSIDPY